MIVSLGQYGKYDTLEDGYVAVRKSEDGLGALVSGSEVGVDSKDKAEDNKKSIFAQSSDRVEISEEARALQRAAAAENPDADEEADKEADDGEQELSDEEKLYKNFAKEVDKLKGIFKDFGTSPGAEEAGGADGGGGDEAIERLRKMLEEAQKKLQEAQEKLQAALAKAKSAEDETAQLAAQTEIEAAQAEVQSIQAEIMSLRNELQKAMEGGGGGGGGMKPPPAAPASMRGGGNYGTGQRISVGPNGITSLQ